MGWWAGGLAGTRKDPGKEEEGGKPRWPHRPPAWVPPAVCAPGTTHSTPYGGRWRLVAAPGRPEAASSAWGRDGNTELVIIDSSVHQAGPDQLSLFQARRAAGWRSPAQAAWGRGSAGEGRSAVAFAATWAPQKRQAQLAFLDPVWRAEGEGLVSQ